VPEAISEIVNRSGAHSTHYAHPEPVEAFVDKVSANAEKWEPVANELNASLGADKARIFTAFTKFLKMRRKLTDGRRKADVRPTVELIAGMEELQ
jgi:hypothetical protein